MYAQSRRIGFHLSTLLALAVLTVTGTHAQATTKTIVETIPFTTELAACGDIIAVDGEIQLVFHVTEDANGGLHITSLFHPQGLTGVSLLSGVRYHAVGETRISVNFTRAFTGTFVNNFKFISEGPGPNFLVHATIHVTINANRDVTAEVENVSIKCRG